MSLHAIPVDVALGSHGPEDGTDVLGVPPVVGWRLPGQGPSGERVLAPHAQVPQDLHHGYLTVQGVEVEAIHLQTGTINTECSPSVHEPTSEYLCKSIPDISPP